MTELICALGPDGAGTVVSRLIQQARTSLEVGMYEVGPSYAWALAAAARRGVRVRLILDGHASDGNAGTAATVMAAGGACRVLRRADGAAHWKLLVVDGRQVAVGTGNLIWRDAPRDPRGRVPPDATPLRGTREWWLVSDASTAVDAAVAALAVAWDRGIAAPSRWGRRLRAAAAGDVGVPAPQVRPLRLVVGAGSVRLVTGGLPVAAAELRLIERARSRVLVIAPYLSSRAAAVRRLLAASRQAARGGADVRLLLGTPPHARDAALLARDHVAARWMDPLVSTRGHAKGLIADGVAVIGSANWSRAGFGSNWELAALVRDGRVAGYLAESWERDWAQARALAELPGDCRLALRSRGYARPDVC